MFDLDHVRRLRLLGIVGVLTGTLPKAPQQNVFLGLPLRLSFYEAVWLVTMGYGILVHGARYHERLALLGATFKDTQMLQLEIEYTVVGDTYERVDAETVRETSVATAIAPETLMLELYGESTDKPCLLSSAFAHLRANEYYMMPGLRFGGDFVAYPGDPLKYHSHLIVRVLNENESFDLLQLVTSGRLATAVKKAWILMAEDPIKEKNCKFQAPVRSFSVEWAGFG